MGKKSYFATIKCIIYDFIDKKRRIFASVKTNGRCDSFFPTPTNILGMGNLF